VKNLFVFLCVIFFSFSLRSQSRELDSLIILAKKYKSSCSSPCINDSIKVNILDDISWALKSIDVDTALIVANEQLELAEKISWKKGVARAYTQKAICLRYIGKYNEAINNLNSAIAIWEELMTVKGYTNAAKLGKIKALYQLSNIYSSLGKYLEAIKYGEISLKLAEEINDKKMMAGQIGNLGIVYQNIADFPKALECYYKSLKLAEELGEKRSIGVNYVHISSILRYQNEFKKALEYLEKSLKIAIELGDVQMQGAIIGDFGTVYEAAGDIKKSIEYTLKSIKITHDLNDVYSESFKWSELCARYAAINEYDKSLEAGNIALKLATETGSENLISYSLEDLGICKIKMKNYREAEKDLLRSLALSEKNGELERIEIVESILSDLYQSTGNYELAFRHYKKHISLRDSMNNRENSRKLIKNELNFEFDKKEAVLKEQQEKERLLSEEASRRQNIIIFSVIIVLCVVLFFTYMVVKSLRVTKKQKQIIEEKEKETQQQNVIITQQKHLVEEKHKEITDSINYAERIQRSLLASKDLLDKNLKDHFVYFQPKDVVSGDFYWATELSSGKFILATADSTGHGVPGAIMSILNISCLKESVKEGLVEPADILNNTRKLIVEILKKDGSAEGGKDGMDCSLLLFDLKNNEFTYSAANNPVWIIRQRKLIEFEPDKMPVGKHDKDTIPFKQHTIKLQKGDVVYTFTDGLPDQFGGEKGKKFMYKRMKELFISVSELSPKQQKESIANMFNNWKGDLEQVDDVCVIGVKV